MRIAACFLLLLPLVGCSVVPRAAWTFDPIHAAPKETLATQEAVALTERTAQLQIQRNGIRARIAAEPNVWARQRLYGELHSVGMELSPLERTLGAVSSAR